MDFGQLPMEVVIRYARKMHLLPAKLNPSAPPTTPYTPQPGTGTQQAMDTTGMERALSDNTSANSAFILNSFMDTVAVQHYTKSPQDYQKLLDICHLHYHQIEVAEKDILPWFVYSVHARGKTDPLFVLGLLISYF